MFTHKLELLGWWLQNNNMHGLYLWHIPCRQTVPMYVFMVIAEEWNARVLTDEVSLLLLTAKVIFLQNAGWYFDKFICKEQMHAEVLETFTQGVLHFPLPLYYSLFFSSFSVSFMPPTPIHSSAGFIFLLLHTC